MGLLSTLAGGLLTGPLHGLEWVARQVAEIADSEMNDPKRIEAELRALAAALEAGEITEAAFEAREAELLAELEALQDAAGNAGQDEASP